MSKDEALEVIKSTFFHLFCEEQVMIGNVLILLHFPSIGIAVLDTDENKRTILDNNNIEDMDSLLIKKELGAKTVYLDVEEDDFNIGFVIHDILMEAKYEPTENFLENRGEVQK